jgi:hypothetical protein
LPKGVVLILKVFCLDEKFLVLGFDAVLNALFAELRMLKGVRFDFLGII